MKVKKNNAASTKSLDPKDVVDWIKTRNEI